MSDKQTTTFEGWVILELMGHRRLAGFLTEQELGGTSFLRLDIPGPDGQPTKATQLYSASAVYCITPTTEAVARRVAAISEPEPVTPWELRQPKALPVGAEDDDDCPV